MQTAQYNKKQRTKRLTRRLLWLVLAVLVIAYPIYSLERPLPSLRPAIASAQLSAQTPASSLVWPQSVQAALGIKQLGVSETSGAQTPLPIASTAKVLAALSILHAKPLQLNQQGPTITISDADVAIYNQYVAQDGSVVDVTSGEQFSEYQMLQAMMLPSANNMADSLAIWAFGSLDAYHSFANQYALQLGMTNTHSATDASGFSPNTTSTAADLVKLGQAAMDNPVLASIVSQNSAVLPQTGTIYNVNPLLGTDNVVGIKTGNTDQAGGVFIGAAKTMVGGKQLIIVSAVVDAPNLERSLTSSDALLNSAQSNFTNATIIKANAVVGDYKAPWSKTIIQATAQHDLQVYAWRGSKLAATIKLQSITAKTTDGQTVGSITASGTALSVSHSDAVIIRGNAARAPALWRLLHPF